MGRRLTIQELTNQTESKYALVVAAARRARAIMDGHQPLMDATATKPVTIALQEIHQGLIHVEVPPVGIK
ncbi:MAG: DNA-directed RNA polymerase subunit omega [Firmicutes bacterium]|jgi:DNA-directed RNA polymerase subunit omega|nr:DNA-directed RNA polymerase subunit omega [Bacillota bacterium]MCL5972334.1 DNA-directed RNA polymerase subunit omega [Bacillota bacterium]